MRQVTLLIASKDWSYQVTSATSRTQKIMQARKFQMIGVGGR